MKIVKFVLAALLAMGLAAPAMAAEEIVINGSTTVLPIMQKAAEAYMAQNPGVTLSVSGGGSGNGVKALIDGLTAIAMSSRDMKDNEIELAKSKGVNPVRTAIAIDALAPVVHPSNKIKELSLAQLQSIYMGKVSNWKELGGEDGPIVVISRDTSSGTYESWEELVMKKEKVAPSALLQASSGAVVQAVSKNKNAIGYVGLGYLDASVKALGIGGVEANAANALSKKWPVSRELYVFTNGEPKGEVGKLVKYLLDPAKGQKHVAEVGFVPLGK